MTRSRNSPHRLPQLQKFIKCRKAMYHSGAFSFSHELGRAVIITSGATAEERRELRYHAEQLSEDESRHFVGAEIVSQPDKPEVIRLLQDAEVADVAFVGDGNFGTMHLSQGNNTEKVTWYDLAKNTTHLKQGVIEERTCTKIKTPDKEVRVSLGSLVVSDQTSILGTVNKTFATFHGHREFSEQLTHIYAKPHNTAHELRQPVGFSLDHQQ